MHDLCAVTLARTTNLRSRHRHLGHGTRRVKRMQAQAAGRSDNRGNRDSERSHRLRQGARRRGHKRLDTRGQCCEQRRSERSEPLTIGGVVDVQHPHIELAARSRRAASTREAITGQEWRRATSMPPLLPSAPRARRSSSSRWIAAATARGSAGSTSRPLTPSQTASGGTRDVAGNDRLAVSARLEVGDPEALAVRAARHRERAPRAAASGLALRR